MIPRQSPQRPQNTATTYRAACEPLLNERIILVAELLLFGVILLLLGSFLGTLWSLFSARTIWYTVCIYFMISLLLVMRKNTIKVERQVQRNLLAAILFHLGSKESWGFIILYMFSGLVMGVSYFKLLGERDITTNFILPEGSNYGIRQLNPRYIFVLVTSASLGVAYGIRSIINERNHLRFPVIQQTHFFTLKGCLPTIITTSVRFAWSFIWQYYIVYIFARGILYRIFAVFWSIFIPVLDDPLVWHSIFDIHIFVRMYLASIMMVSAWELLNTIFEICFTQAVAISEYVVDPNACLVSGLTLYEKPYIRALAFLELQRLAKYSSQRRISLYRDIDCTPSIWQQISTECIKVIMELTKALEDDLKNPGGGISSIIQLKSKTYLDTISKQPAITPTSPNRLKVVNADIFSPRKNQTFLDSLKTTSKAVSSEPSNEPGKIDTTWTLTQRKTTSQITSHSNVSDKNLPAQITATKTPTTPADTVQKRFDAAMVFLKSFLMRWKFGRLLLIDTIERKTQALFKNLQVDTWAIQALACLTSFSYHEDRYGTVQHDISKVLECLIRCLMATERYLHEPKLPPGTVNVTRISATPNQILLREPHALVIVLHEAIYEIVTTFYEHLSEFKFPPVIALRLQRFIEFQE